MPFLGGYAVILVIRPPFRMPGFDTPHSLTSWWATDYILRSTVQHLSGHQLSLSSHHFVGWDGRLCLDLHLVLMDWVYSLDGY